jgi:hypothetical protein
VGTAVVEGFFCVRLRKKEVYSEGGRKKENAKIGGGIHKICVL